MTCTCGADRITTIAKGNDYGEEVLPIIGTDTTGKRVYHAGPITVYFVAAEETDTPLGGVSKSVTGVGSPARFYPQFDAAEMNIVIDAAGTPEVDIWRVVSGANDLRRTRRIRVLKSLPDAPG